jgi:DNA-binding transcriptional regulator LsrR (DeoR family)
VLSEKERLRALGEICKYKNKEYGTLKQKGIAEKLKLSEKEVSDIFRKGFRDGLVEITFNSPLDLELETKLRLILSSVIIRTVIVGEAEGSTGYVAARYLESEITNGKTIVLDGGLTVFDFVRELNLPKSTNLTIIPIAADPPSYKISAYELMTRLSVKLPYARGEKLPHFKGGVLDTQHQQIASKAREADFVFLGAGPCRENHTALDFVEYLGIEPRKFKADHQKIAYMCGYCGIDLNGKEVKFTKKFEDRMRRALSFEDLRTMAANPKKVVALLANGKEKVDVVATVIKAGIVNTLFLDGPLAVALLDREKPSTP